MSRVAVGFRVHLGWAAAVAVAGTRKAPRVVLRERVALENAVPESHEPYHKAAELRDDLGRARAVIRTGTRAVRGCARRELGRLLRALERDGHRAVGIGVLQAGGGQLALESILASHAMVHVAEGRLMREALARASEGRDLPVLALSDKTIAAAAAERLGLGPESLRDEVKALGAGLGPPWTTDQKNAALIAWLALSGMRSPRGATPGGR